MCDGAQDRELREQNQLHDAQHTVLTRAATRFVTPLLFQSLTGRPARTSENLWASEGHVVHVGLGEAADSIDAAVKAVIDEGYRTGDIYTGAGDQKQVGTTEMGDAIVDVCSRRMQLLRSP